jgi:hypothetical protein
MASTFKQFLPSDLASTRTLLHEAIPITGTIVSGTYTADGNIKTYAHGMFESVYDYPFLSSSANHIFDITWGYSNNSSAAVSAGTKVQETKKRNLYDEMALILTNLDISGNIRNFDRDGEIDDDQADDMKEVFFLNFTRLLTKDEIKKGSFFLSLFSSGTIIDAARGNLITIGDYGALTDYKINSPAGDYGLLFTSSVGVGTDPTNISVGHLYYQAGIAVVTASVFSGEFGNLDTNVTLPAWTGSMSSALTGATITELADGLRYTFVNVAFNNTTELNSTIYFCRAHNTDFNYSSNPTYLSASEIRVKGQNPLADPVSYLTTVGLYSPDNELLAVAKVSEPLKKTPANELTLRVRLDY